MEKTAIGIDIGGTNSVFGLVTRNGRVLAEGNVSTSKHRDVESFMNDITGSLKEMISGINNIEVVGIGIGAPNGNYYKGTIEYAPNLNWKGVVPLVDLFEAVFDYKTIILTNDANAAAIGEMVYGDAKGLRDFIMITLGTGLGSGIVINGELVYGHDGFAGELGHVIVDRAGRVCGCGRRGCLETYVSAPGIKRTVFELLADSREDSLLRKYTWENLDAKIIFDAAEKADRIALEAFDITSEILGKTLADAVAFSSPQAIFLFGGLANAGKYIFGPTKSYMEKNMLEVFRNKVSILPSKLDGARAAILGASALVWKEANHRQV